MAITEADYLLLRDEKGRDWLMLKSERQFHLVRVDAALTEKAHEKLMKRYPCSLRQLHELGLHVTPLNREKCTHATFEGTKAGDRLILWFSGDIRDYAFGADYTREGLEAFFDTQQHRWDIVGEPEGPPKPITQFIGWTLNGLTFLLLLASLLARGIPWGWLRWLCLAAFAVSVGLCIRWPGRFLADDLRKRREKRKVYRADMELPVFGLPLVMVLDVMEGYTYRDGLFLLIFGAVLGLVLAAAILWRSRAYRSGGIGLLIGLMLLSGGVVAQVNQLLDFSPTTEYTVTVEQTEQSRSGRGGTRYYCHVTMPDGEQEQFSIPRSRYKELSPGDPVTVVVHDGGLGLAYLTIDWDE